jgi:DNA-binding response OmpR family regulator
VAWPRSDAMNEDASNAGHILIVDDDPAMQQMIVDYFEDHNVSTSVASNQNELNRHHRAARARRDADVLKS